MVFCTKLWQFSVNHWGVHSSTPRLDKKHTYVLQPVARRESGVPRVRWKFQLLQTLSQAFNRDLKISLLWFYSSLQSQNWAKRFNLTSWQRKILLILKVKLYCRALVEFMQKWRRDSSVLSVLYYMRCGVQNFASAAYMALLDTRWDCSVWTWFSKHQVYYWMLMNAKYRFVSAWLPYEPVW